jgi:DnaJ-class molecular chaperone
MPFGDVNSVYIGKRCPKCKGKGFLGKARWSGNEVCKKCGGS